MKMSWYICTLFLFSMEQHMSQHTRLWYLSHMRTAKARCASAKSRQSLRCSHTCSIELDEGSDQESVI